jgi:hypothetical protein
MGADYDHVVPGLFPGARPYKEAMGVVWPRIKALIPERRPAGAGGAAR